MTFLTIADKIVPGYELLPEEIRAVFEESISGQQFTQLINNTLLLSEQLKDSFGLWNWITGNYDENKQKLHDEFAQQKEELIECIRDSAEYKKIIQLLMFNTLTSEYPDFTLLTEEQQKLLSATECSEHLLEPLASLDRRIFKKTIELSTMDFWTKRSVAGTNLADYIAQLNIDRKNLISDWINQRLENSDMSSLVITLESKKEVLLQEQKKQDLLLLNEHAKELAAFFPLLNYRKFKNEAPVVNQLYVKYAAENNEQHPTIDTIDEEHLTDLFFHCMQQVSQIEINFLNLDAFNKKHANRIAKVVLKGFKEKSEANMDNLFHDYETKLQKHIIKQLQLINHKNWQIKQSTVTEELFESLSFLWSSKAVNKSNEFLGKMADAHAFIQATNFSTQNESSFLAILDVYNYGRYHEQISEVKTIIASLFWPLQSLYREYKDIAFYEKNVYWKAFRTLMPIIVTAAFIILVSLLLAPLGLPELAITVAFIPSFLIGLALATSYVTVKNDIYKYFRDQYYGGPFEIPEFQVNARMLSAFGNQEKSQKVRTFYVASLQHCDEIESQYKEKHEQGILNEEDIRHRKENIIKRHHLSLEWYDIHSNKDLTYEKAPLIVLNRLQEASDEQYLHLQSELKLELGSIQKSISQVISDLKTTLITHNKVPVFELDEEIEATTIKSNYSYGLFSPPRCLQHKARTEELHTLHEQISDTALKH